MLLAEAQSAQSAPSWSAEEDLIIKTIQQAESVPRAEAIRRMQRRKKASSPMVDSPPMQTTQRLCRNPRCTRGDDGGPGSLAHLRADALYCDGACRKAAKRGPRRGNQPSNRQCLCGSKADKFGSLVSTPYADEHAS